jgi:hypothetical protein
LLRLASSNLGLVTRERVLECGKEDGSGEDSEPEQHSTDPASIRAPGDQVADHR